MRSPLRALRPGAGGGPVTLHIGTPKSGTTYLQARLRAVRGLLADQGVLYPGAGYLPQEGLNQQPAVYALAGQEVGRATGAVRATGARHLRRLRAEMRSHRGRVLLSAEILASFQEPAIRDLLRTLRCPPERVQVVITCRDAGRLLTSVWQQNIKNGATHDQRTYLSNVARLRGAGYSPFWTAYGLPDLVDRWADVVGMRNVCLVTAPQTPTPEDDLWTRFARACELTGLDQAGADATERMDSNVSLTAPQAELLRQVNMLLDAEDLDARECREVRARLLRAWMSQTPIGSRRLGLAPDWLPRLQDWAEQDRAALTERVGAGLHLIGDLRDLDPAPRLVDGADAELSATDAARDVLAVLRSS